MAAGSRKRAGCFRSAPEPFIDLSTGINPVPYPFAAPAARAFTRLPEPEDEAALQRGGGARLRRGRPGDGGRGARHADPHQSAAAPAARCATWPSSVRPTRSTRAAWAAAGRAVAETRRLGRPAAGGQASLLCNPNNPDGRVVPPPISWRSRTASPVAAGCWWSTRRSPTSTRPGKPWQPGAHAAASRPPRAALVRQGVWAGGHPARLRPRAPPHWPPSYDRHSAPGRRAAPPSRSPGRPLRPPSGSMPRPRDWRATRGGSMACWSAPGSASLVAHAYSVWRKLKERRACSRRSDGPAFWCVASMTRTADSGSAFRDRRNIGSDSRRLCVRIGFADRAVRLWSQRRCVMVKESADQTLLVRVAVNHQTCRVVFSRSQAARAAAMKARISAGSFTPGVVSTPEDTSTPGGPAARIAAATLPGSRPPASSQGPAPASRPAATSRTAPRCRRAGLPPAAAWLPARAHRGRRSVGRQVGRRRDPARRARPAGRSAPAAPPARAALA